MASSLRGMVPVMLGVVALWPATVEAQDLFDRIGVSTSNSNQDLVYASRYRGRDRMDLRMGGSFPTATVVPADRGYARIGLDSVIDADFACGRFDVKANIKHLLSKEVRDDFVDTLIGAVESELMYNALVLACEVSPTLCDAFKHFRANANFNVGLGYDKCAAVESAINDGLQSAQAQAIKDCVERARQSGVTDTNEALARCKREHGTSGLLGDRTASFHLGEELEKVFDLDPGTAQDLQVLLSELRIRGNGVSGEVKADGVLQEYRRIEGEYIAAWTETVDGFGKNPNSQVPSEEMKKLYPEGLPMPLRVELQEIARIPVEERRLRIRKVASREALVEITKRVQDLERRLAAAAQLPQNSEGRLRLIEQTIRDLRLQLRHIQELARVVDEYNHALSELSDAGQSYRDGNAARQLSRGKSDEFRSLKAERARRFGSRRPPLNLNSTSTRSSSGVATPSNSVRGCAHTDPANCNHGTAPPSLNFGSQE